MNLCFSSRSSQIPTLHWPDRRDIPPYILENYNHQVSVNASWNAKTTDDLFNLSDLEFKDDHLKINGSLVRPKVYSFKIVVLEPLESSSSNDSGHIRDPFSVIL